jgi:hypothetical protein
MNNRETNKKDVRNKTQLSSLPLRPAWIPTQIPNKSYMQEPIMGNTFLPNSGYVHSGYQAAIQGTTLPQANRSTIHPHPIPIHPTQVSTTSYTAQKSTRQGPGGPVRCGYSDCPYSGYPKDVEVHRMDRHLVFPPGYKPQKGPPDGEIGFVLLIHAL